MTFRHKLSYPFSYPPAPPDSFVSFIIVLISFISQFSNSIGEMFCDRAPEKSMRPLDLKETLNGWDTPSIFFSLTFWHFDIFMFVHFHIFSIYFTIFDSYILTFLYFKIYILSKMFYPIRGCKRDDWYFSCNRGKEAASVI